MPLMLKEDNHNLSCGETKTGKDLEGGGGLIRENVPKLYSLIIHNHLSCTY